MVNWPVGRLDLKVENLYRSSRIVPVEAILLRYGLFCSGHSHTSRRLPLRGSLPGNLSRMHFCHSMGAAQRRSAERSPLETEMALGSNGDEPAPVELPRFAPTAAARLLSEGQRRIKQQWSLAARAKSVRLHADRHRGSLEKNHG